MIKTILITDLDLKQRLELGYFSLLVYILLSDGLTFIIEKSVVFNYNLIILNETDVDDLINTKWNWKLDKFELISI